MPTEPVLSSVTLTPPFYVLSTPVNNERTAAPCGLVLDTTTGKQHAPLFTSVENLRYYQFRTGAKGDPKSLGMMSSLVELAQILRLRHPNVEGFLLNPKGGRGPQQFLTLHDAMTLT